MCRYSHTHTCNERHTIQYALTHSRKLQANINTPAHMYVHCTHIINKIKSSRRRRRRSRSHHKYMCDAPAPNELVYMNGWFLTFLQLLNINTSAQLKFEWHWQCDGAVWVCVCAVLHTYSTRTFTLKQKQNQNNGICFCFNVLRTRWEMNRPAGISRNFKWVCMKLHLQHCIHWTYLSLYVATENKNEHNRNDALQLESSFQMVQTIQWLIANIC